MRTAAFSHAAAHVVWVLASSPASDGRHRVERRSLVFLIVLIVAEHEIAEGGSSVSLHAGHDVCVDLHCERDGRVAETLTHHLGWDTRPLVSRSP